MEEDKYCEPNTSLFGEMNQYYHIDEEKNNRHDYESEQALFEEERIKSIHGDSGFDDLAPQSFIEEHNPIEDLLMKNNTVFKRLFSDHGELPDNLLEGMEDLNPQAQNVLDFFNKNTTLNGTKKGTPKQNGAVKSSTDHNSQNDKIEEIDESMEDDEEENDKFIRKRQYKQKAIDKLREKQRIKKMNRKEKDTNSESGKSLTANSSKSPIDESAESVAPQKRKGTIWKILFPEKNFEEKELDLEKLVCRQVEHHISKDPSVIKSYQDLKVFEESEESKQMSKAEYTKKKNRISAQLSRERREAILHSLINVCIENIKAKKDLDSDIQEVKQVLKDTLCTSCCTKLKGAQYEENKTPSTRDKKAAGTPQITNRRNNSALTISRPGTWGILMSFAVIACVLSVAFLDGNNTSSAIGGLPNNLNTMPRRYLSAEPSYEKVLEELSGEESDTVPDVYINELISSAREVYLNRDTSLVQSTSLYKKVDFSNCGHNNQNYNSPMGYEVEEDDYNMESEYQTIKYKINEIKEINSDAYKYHTRQMQLPGKEKNGNLPATISQVISTDIEEPTFYCKNSEILSDGKFFVQKSDCNVFNIWMPVSDLINNVAASDLLNSLGLPSQSHANLDKNNFIEFKCEINNINLVSGKNMGLAA